MNAASPEWEPLREIEFLPTPCPVCRSEQGELRFKKPIRGITMEYWLCADCDTLYAKNRATPASLRNVFSSKDFFAGGKPGDDVIDYFDYIGGEKYLRMTARSRLERIARHAPRGKLLEVASAAGFFLVEAKEAGYDARGVEFSAPMARYASERWGVPVIAGSIETTDLPESELDVIASWGMLTIIQDPVAMIRKFHRALKPGGVWAFNTYYHDGLWPRMVGANWNILYLHFSQILTRQKLLEIVSREGFELVSKRRDLPYTDLLKVADQLALNFRTPWLPRAIEKAGLGKLIIRLPLPDVREYIWRKK